MKKAGLIIGILGMILSGIIFVVCLALPALTNDHVSRTESMMGIIPALIVFFLALIVTVISAIFFFKAKKNAAQMPSQYIR